MLVCTQTIRRLCGNAGSNSVSLKLFAFVTSSVLHRCGKFKEYTLRSKDLKTLELIRRKYVGY
jgi:hypothetical protein